MDLFDRIAAACARFTGRPAMMGICGALSALGVAAYVSGQELFISGANLSISIVTLLLLPILQGTQNRDGAALQAKLDELIQHQAGARDVLIGLEKQSEDEIESVRAERGREP